MNAFILALLLIGGDGFQWTVTESPSFSWTVTEGGDNASLPNDSAVPATDGQPFPDGASGSPPAHTGAPSDLRSAIRAYRDSGGVRYYVRGKSDSQHLTQDHGWSAEQIRGLGLDELQFLHGATHTGKIQPNLFVAAPGSAAPFTPADATPRPSGADTKPAITITVAPFHCPPCNQLKRMDWKDFDVTWKTGGNVRAYPEISWTDKRGTKRTLTGAYSPWRVRWSYDRTMD